MEHAMVIQMLREVGDVLASHTASTQAKEQAFALGATLHAAECAWIMDRAARDGRRDVSARAFATWEVEAARMVRQRRRVERMTIPPRFRALGRGPRS